MSTTQSINPSTRLGDDWPYDVTSEPAARLRRRSTAAQLFYTGRHHISRNPVKRKAQWRMDRPTIVHHFEAATVELPHVTGHGVA